MWDRSSNIESNIRQSKWSSERMVQVTKNLIKKSSLEGKSYHTCLQEIRNTPLTYGMLSPAKLLQGRTLRSKIPCSENALFPHAYDKEKVKLAMQAQNDNSYF